MIFFMKNDTTAQMFYTNTPLTVQDIGDNVPKRDGKIAKILADKFLKLAGWQIIGDIPNIKKAVLLAVPHTSNFDGVFAIPTLLALDVDIRLLGKKELFKVPVLAQVLRWGGVISIDRQKQGSTLQASIDEFAKRDKLFIALAPEGTRKFTDAWKTGFYYLAMGAGVPIIPIAMDYKSREVRFMMPFVPTGDIDKDLPKLYAYYHGVVGKNPNGMSKPLQDLKRRHSN